MWRGHSEASPHPQYFSRGIASQVSNPKGSFSLVSALNLGVSWRRGWKSRSKDGNFSINYTIPIQRSCHFIVWFSKIACQNPRISRFLCSMFLSSYHPGSSSSCNRIIRKLKLNLCVICGSPSPPCHESLRDHTRLMVHMFEGFLWLRSACVI